MSSDECEIRRLVERWMEGTRAGDVDAVLSLMTDDVVFLIAGHAPMDKAAFAAAAAAQSHANAPKIDGRSEIQEIRVLGDWAYMLSRLTVTVTPPQGAKPATRAGHTLSILRKQNGRWLLARDANMLQPVEPS